MVGEENSLWDSNVADRATSNENSKLFRLDVDDYSSTRVHAMFRNSERCIVFLHGSFFFEIMGE